MESFQPFCQEVVIWVKTSQDCFRRKISIAPFTSLSSSLSLRHRTWRFVTFFCFFDWPKTSHFCFFFFFWLITSNFWLNSGVVTNHFKLQVWTPSIELFNFYKCIFSNLDFIFLNLFSFVTGFLESVVSCKSLWKL